MQDKFIQGVRYKLQRRVRRLNSVPPRQFPVLLKPFFDFIDSTPILAGVRDDLLARTEPELVEVARRIFTGEGIYENSEKSEAALGYHVLRLNAEDSQKYSITRLNYGGKDIAGYLDRMREVFLEPFYEYLDEHIDDQQAILYFLRQYKHRSEWFQAERLRKILEDNTQSGEKLLAFDLYEFLHGQGINFHIEPQSASGIADLVAEQVGNDRVVADAKIFWTEKSKGKSYIISGFHQAYTYARDFNEAVAYLVVFKMSKEDINFLMPSDAKDAMFPNFSLNNKTIFFVVVDICDHGASASKRKALTSIEISAEDLIKSVKDALEAQPAL